MFQKINLVKKNLKKTAVILCGGRGTRLGALGKISKNFSFCTRERNILVYNKLIKIKWF